MVNVTKEDIKEMKLSQLKGTRKKTLEMLEVLNKDIDSRYNKSLDWWTYYGQAVSNNKPNADQFACNYADDVMEITNK